MNDFTLISVTLPGTRKPRTVKAQIVISFLDEIFSCKIDIIEGTGRLNRGTITVLVRSITSVVWAREQIRAIMVAVYPECVPPLIEFFERDTRNRWIPMIVGEVNYAERNERKRIRRSLRQRHSRKAVEKAAASNHPGGKRLLKKMGDV